MRCTWPKVFGTGILSVAILTSAASAARAQGDKIYDRILKSTVWIAIPVKERATPDGRVPIRMGTGTLIDTQKKIILTNFHVVGDAKEIFVFFPAYKNKDLIPERKHYVDALNNGGGLRGATVAKEPKIDLALIQLETVPEGAKVMPLAKDTVSPGQSIHSVGNPGVSGALWVYTAGRVRQVYQKQFRSSGEGVSLDIDARVVETDSPTNPGDSGGPLVNDRCELVGVTQGLAPNARNVSTFIDLSEVRTFLSKAKIRPVIASGGPAKEKDTEEEKKTAAAKPMTPTKTASPEEQKERAASFKLKNAQQFASDGDVKSAAEFCEEILTKYPMTKAATDAKSLLEKLKSKKKD